VMTTVGLGLGMAGVLAVSGVLIRISKFDREPTADTPIRLEMSRAGLNWGRIGVCLVIWSALLQVAGAWLPQEMGG